MPAILLLATLLSACDLLQGEDAPGERAEDPPERAEPIPLDEDFLSEEATSLPAAGGEGDALPDAEPEALTPVDALAGDLGVLGVSPTGRVPLAQQVVVHFDRPMVPLAELDDPAAAVPLSCEPALPAQARWAGTRTAALVATGGESFPMASRWDCEVPAGTAAIDGAALEGPLSFQFETPPPDVERFISPRDGAKGVNLDAPILVRFNQPVAPSAVAARAVLTADGEEVPFTAERPEDHGEDTVAILAVRAPDTDYLLEIEAGVVGLEGPLPSEEAHRLVFRTYEPLATQESEPVDGATDLDPFVGLRLRFNNRVESDEVVRHLDIQPPPPEPLQEGGGWSSTWWRRTVRLAPRTDYTVTLKPGLVDVHGQALDTRRTWRFSTGDFDPLLDGPTGALIYPANNVPEIPLRARNVEAIEVAYGRVAPEALRRMASGGSGDWVTEFADLEMRRPELALAESPNEVQMRAVDISAALTDGRGLVALEYSAPEITDHRGRPVRYRALLQVTDLGVHLKLGPRGTTVWVTRLSDGAPVEGAQVTLRGPGGEVFVTDTDAGGVSSFDITVTPPDWKRWSQDAWVEVRHEGDLALTTHRWDEGLSPWDHDVSARYDNDGRRWQLAGFTDRGIYRLGDQVHARVTARELNADGLGVSAGDVAWELSDPEGAMIRQGEGRLDDRGGFSLSAELPGEGALGAWSLRFTSQIDDGDEIKTWLSVPVKAFRAPTFRVDLDAPEGAMPGEEIAVIARASYLFGSPMGDAPVSWQVRERKIAYAPPGWEGFSFAPPSDRPWWWSPTDGGSAFVHSEEGRMSPGGGDRLSLTPEADTRARRLTFSADVTDAARQVVRGSADVVVHPGPAYVGIKLADWFAPAGQPVQAEVVAVSPEGEAMPGRALSVAVARRTWDSARQKQMDGTWRWVSTPRDEPVTTLEVTSGGGAQRAAFTPEEAGFYLIHVTDEGGVSAGTTLYVWGGDAAWAMDDAGIIDLVPDKKRYAPGEVARILVKAPAPGLTALITTEREGVLTRRAQPLEGTAATIEIPIEEGYAPNVFASVVLVEGAPPQDSPDAGLPRVWMGYTDLMVSAEDRRLGVEITTDQGDYRPRDEVSIEVTVTRAGAPAAGAGVTLYAVDYAVLSLTDYQTPDLHERFYTPRPLGVLTADGRTRVLDRGKFLAKGGETGGGGGAAFDGTMRSDFVETPLWIGDLRAGDDGVASASFTLPDNLTTFRVMAVVDHGADAFGRGEREFTVSRPLIASPAMPRFLRSGDRALAGVVVHNHSGEPAAVEVSAQATGAMLGGAPARVEVPPHGALEVPFQITASETGRATFEFEVRSDAGDRDGVIWNLQVYEAASREVVATSGATTERAVEALLLPEDAMRDRGGLQVDLAPTVLMGLQGPMDYLLEYPHGCSEQVASRTMAALLTLELGAKAGGDDIEEALRAAIAAGVDKLATFETGGGGLSVWPGRSRVSPMGTAWGLEVLHRARAQGFPVDDQRIEDLIATSREILGGAHCYGWWSEAHCASVRSRAALTLARIGHGDAGYNAQLYADHESLSPAAQAELMEALWRTAGGDEHAAELSRLLTARVRVEATGAALVAPDDGGQWRRIWYSEDLANAAYLGALVADPEESDLATKLARHVVASRAGGRWNSTWSTITSLRALADYAARYEAGDGPVTGAAILGGKEILRERIARDGSAGAALPMADLEHLLGEQVELEFASSPGDRLYYEARLATWRPSLPARDEGFTLRRTERLLSGGGEGGRVEPGAVVEITLSVITPVERFDVALVDPLPGGLEAIDAGLATAATVDAPTEQPMGASRAFNHRELRDDRVVLFADHMPAGIHTFRYQARATTPGAYARPSAQVEEMYTPEIFGRTSAGRFVVGRD